MRTRTLARASRLLITVAVASLLVSAVAQNPFQGFPEPPPLQVPEAPEPPEGDALPLPQPVREMTPTPELRRFKPANAPKLSPNPQGQRAHFRWPARLALTEPLPEGVTPDLLLTQVELLAINRGSSPSVALRVGGQVLVLRVGESIPDSNIKVTNLLRDKALISNGTNTVALELTPAVRTERSMQ